MAPEKPPARKQPLKKAAPAAEPSYREIYPTEEGGRHARKGFEFQDHIAAGKCLDMILGDGILEVWCEAEDDIVVVRATPGGEYFEFVQVKSDLDPQAWSVARLCKKITPPALDIDSPTPRKGPAKAPSKCIIEKSLSHDRGRGDCRFRLVTCWGPDQVLSCLVHELDSEARKYRSADIAAAGAALAEKLGVFCSENGNGCDFWAERTHWEVVATSETAKNENLLKLRRVLEMRSLSLLDEDQQLLYSMLFLRVQDAAVAHGKHEKPTKQLQRVELTLWLYEKADKILRPGIDGSTKTLVRKFGEANITGSLVQGAIDQLRHYNRKILGGGFLDLESRDSMEADASFALHRLKTQLEAGDIVEDGPRFLLRSQKALAALCETKDNSPAPSEWFLTGYLYALMNRCGYHLIRESP